ncbi:MAG: hypothetical protein ACKOA8_08175 [Deltaproteobacteria bacterium]
MYHYSLKEGLYFEFSLMGLLLLGIAGLSRSTRLAIATLAFILPQVVVWFLEAILFCFSNESFFGLFEARFHPAISISDFYIYQYPLVLIPLSWALIRSLPTPTSTPWKLTLAFSGMGLLLSRFVFRGDSDINCSTLACLELFYSIPAKYYPWFFLLLYSLGSLVSVFLLNWYFSKETHFSLSKKHPAAFLTTYVLFAFTLLLNHSNYFLKKPKFYCQSSERNPNGVELNCKYALDISGTHFSQYFSTTNRSAQAQECNLYYRYQEKKEIMYPAVLIRPKKTLTLSIAVPNPVDPKGTTIVLTPECVAIQ